MVSFREIIYWMMMGFLGKRIEKTAIVTIPASSSSGWSTSDNRIENALYSGKTESAYYTWCVATAGTCSSATSGGVVASGSICPKGWRLPSNTEYSTLLTSAGISNNTAGSTKIQSMPYNFSYTGWVSGGSLSSVGSEGYYWSSTAYNSTVAYYLYFSNSVVSTSFNGRYFGIPIRCIAL